MCLLGQGWAVGQIGLMGIYVPTPRKARRAEMELEVKEVNNQKQIDPTGRVIRKENEASRTVETNQFEFRECRRSDSASASASASLRRARPSTQKTWRRTKFDFSRPSDRFAGRCGREKWLKSACIVPSLPGSSRLQVLNRIESSRESRVELPRTLVDNLRNERSKANQTGGATDNNNINNNTAARFNVTMARCR